MVERCMVCHKDTRFEQVTYSMNPLRREIQHVIPTLWYCSECHMVIFREEPIPESEKKAAKERAELLEGFD